ncbi:MAG: PLP-dependent aminotransferase family protein [Ardenticatenaceae bacterium]|nr:PLP-dependent aminotransferase family protein [Ardenticatenaceae bacterium]
MQIAQVNVPADLIHFGVGQPGFDLLPLDLLRRAAAHRLGQDEPALLQYGLETGSGYFRQALAGFLSQGYGTAVSPDHLFTTNGISQALDMLCTLLTRPGDTIFVEDPTYFLALDIFRDHHLRIISLPVDDDGLIVEALEEKLQAEKPVFVYTIPTFQNPSSVTLSLSRRQRLVELSQTHGFYVLADEVYQLLDYTAVPPQRLFHVSDRSRVISLGSFSKILAPGLRLGWIEAAPALLEQLTASGLLQSGGGLNPFTAEIVRSLLEQGWQTEFLTRLKAVYRSRAAALSRALHHYLPDAEFAEPDGGFFIWVKLPQVADTAVLLEQLRPYHVAYHPGLKFSAQQGLRQFLRLSFAFYDEAALEEGVRRLQVGLAALV